MRAEALHHPVSDFSLAERTLARSLCRLGCVERLPNEQPFAHDIRWTAYQARTLLRLGKEGQYIYDPRNTFTSDKISEQALVSFREEIVTTLYGLKDPSVPEFSTSEEQTRAIIRSGVFRRITSFPK